MLKNEIEESKMFKKVLYPTDFSRVANKAVDYIKKLKEAGTEEVVILHVIEDYDLELMVTACEWKESNINKCMDKVKTDLEKKSLKKMEKIGKEIGLKYKSEIRYGKPFHQIVQLAGKEHVSLIVMGSHGKGEFEELLIGSVTENVVRHTKKPVLIVR